MLLVSRFKARCCILVVLLNIYPVVGRLTEQVPSTIVTVRQTMQPIPVPTSTATSKDDEDTRSIMPIPFITALTGPGPPSIYQCWSSWNDMRSASWHGQWGISGFQSTDLTYTMTYSEETKTYTNESIHITKMCDGRPRFLDRAHTKLIVTHKNVSATGWMRPPPLPTPKCTILESECTTIESIWSQATSSWTTAFEAARGWVGYNGFQNYLVSPFCTTTEPRCIPSRCSMHATGATVFYWPTSIVGGDTCAEAGSTITPTPTHQGIPNTANYGSLHMISPTVYMIINSVLVYSTVPKPEPYAGLRQCGPTIPPQVTISAHPREISSLRYGISSSAKKYDFEQYSYTLPVMTSKTLPFDFADMDVLQRPWEAYAGAESNDNNPVWENTAAAIASTFGVAPRKLTKTSATMSVNYSPLLIVPDVLTDLGNAGEFRQCMGDRLISSVTYIPITARSVMMSMSTWLASTARSNVMQTYVGGYP